MQKNDGVLLEITIEQKLCTRWGLYLDTDVVVHRSFDDLLGDRAFIGYLYNFAFCTAIVGSEKGGKFIKGILDMYDSGNFITKNTFLGKNNGEDPYHDDKWAPSNEFWTWYIIKTFPRLSLNNKEQEFEDLHIYPKEYFELGSLFGKWYSRHLNYNSWREKNSGGFARKIKHSPEENEICWMIIRQIIYMKRERETGFYGLRDSILAENLRKKC